MKVMFVNRLFHEVSGGVERMAIVMMNALSARGHVIELLSWDRTDATTYYPLDERIHWHKLDMGDAGEKAGWRLRAQRQLAIRKVVRESRPDVVIAFQHGAFLTMAVAMLGLGIPIIAAERNAPQRFDHLRAGKNRSWIFQTFRLADRITVQLDDYVQGYPEYLRSRIVSIPNPVEPARQFAKPFGEPEKVKRLLTVGRLSYQKNQQVLIEAFAKLAVAMPEWRLVIVGAGEDETQLRQQAIKSGFSDRIEFIGAVKSVEDYYQNSHLFCLPSRWEGFPNALAEAMAHGLPVVGFSDCAGVSQLIASGKNGLLAEGNGAVMSLTKALRSLMQDDARRAATGTAAVSAMTAFTPDAIFDAWESLFKEVGGIA